MDGDSWLSWLCIALLLLMAAYFALAEVSMTTVSRIRLKTRLDRGDQRAKKALYVQEHFDQAISAILIGTNIVHITTATLVTVLVTRTWGASWVAVGTLVCTVAIFFAGEMLPKSIGKKYSERCALATASSLCFFMRIFAPLAGVLTRVGEFLARLSRGEPEVTVTEDELYDIIDDMTDNGALDEERGELVHSALEFADVSAEHVFTPRVDVKALNVNEDPRRVLEFIKAQHHSRLPVYEGTIDNIVGILQIRRYIRAYLRQKEYPALRELLDEPCFVHRSAPIRDLLTELSRRKVNLAVVTDSYGGTLGIITVEDILEELVGEIWDEDDVARVDFQALGGGEYEVDPDMSMEDLLDSLDYEDPEDTEWDRKSVGEWVYEQFDIVPEEGDEFVWHRLRVRVAQMRHRRVLKVRVTLLPEEEEEGGGEE